MSLHSDSSSTDTMFADTARAPFVGDLLFSRWKSYDGARVSICSLEHYRISRNGTADIALGHRGRHWPRCFFIATGLSAALPHVCLAHVDPDRVVHDSVHDVHEPHRGPRPVDLHVPARLVPDAAHHVARHRVLPVALAEPVVGHRRRPGLRAPVGVLRVQELQRDAGFRELAVDAGPVGSAYAGPASPLPGNSSA